MVATEGNRILLLSTSLLAATRKFPPGKVAAFLPPPQPFCSCAHMTILIVDDQPNLTKVTVVALRLLDCHTFTASSTSAADQLFATEKIDAVFLDINLGQENGFEYLSQLMARPNPLPVVMFTAQALDEVAAESARRGAFGCMIKPFSLDDLRNQIARISDHLKPSASRSSG